MQIAKDDMLITTKRNPRSSRQVYINVTRLQDFIRSEGQSVENDPFIRYLGRIPSELFVSGAGIERAVDASRRVQGYRPSMDSIKKDSKKVGYEKVLGVSGKARPTKGKKKERKSPSVHGISDERSTTIYDEAFSAVSSETPNDTYNRISEIDNTVTSKETNHRASLQYWEFRPFSPSTIQGISFSLLMKMSNSHSSHPSTIPADFDSSGSSPAISQATAKFEGILSHMNEGNFSTIERFFATIISNSRNSSFFDSRLAIPFGRSTFPNSKYQLNFQRAYIPSVILLPPKAGAGSSSTCHANVPSPTLW